MISKTAVGLLALAGCTFQSGNGDNADGGLRADAQRIDSVLAVDSMPACLGYEASPFFDWCALPDTGGDNLELEAPKSYVLNTDNRTLSVDGTTTSLTHTALVEQPGEASLLVVVFAKIDVPASARLRVVGSLPLALVATNAINIGGEVVSNGQFAEAGAGANPASCGTGANGAPAMDGDGITARGGGGGGGGGTVGGKGGKIRGGDGAMAAAGVANTDGITLRGGCSGGRGSEIPTGERGLGGGGGGGLALISGEALTIGGVVSVSAGGGVGASSDNAGFGGGGGGSGGELWLIGSNIVQTGWLTANGGGGGAGGHVAGDSNGNGNNGYINLAGRAGGANGTNGDQNRGGAGAAGTLPTTDGGACTAADDPGPCGGGGGGGAVGVIRISSEAMLNPAKISPPAITP